MLPFIKEAVTGLFSRPSTEAYPFKPVEAPLRYRGRIVFHPDLCISCGMCERVCAGGAISTKSEETEEGRLLILTYYGATLRKIGLRSRRRGGRRPVIGVPMVPGRTST